MSVARAARTDPVVAFADRLGQASSPAEGQRASDAVSFWPDVVD
jgi:hypothetical protein